MKKTGVFEFTDVNVKDLKIVFDKNRGKKSIWIENGVNVGEILKASMPYLIQSVKISGKSVIASAMVGYSTDADGHTEINSVVIND